MIGNVTPLIFDPQNDIYNSYGINFGTLSHLETLGLIQFSTLTGFQRTQLPKQIGIFYYGTAVQLTLAKDVDNSLDIGHVMLTNAGQQLAPICGSQPIPEYLEYVRKRWVDQKLIADDATEQTHAPEPATEPDSN